MSERRVNPRRHLKSYLQVLDNNTKNIVGHLVNINQHGAMMISENPISDDTSLRLRLVLPEKFEGNDSIDIRSRSVWCQQDRFNPDLYASGFKIERINHTDETFIDRFIEEFCLKPVEEVNIQVY
ncbi:MAG: PilZ domain-containing protein [Anaerolineales bacterium]|nr:PilZ domain-containing protein [Anaerolineales bacterium]